MKKTHIIALIVVAVAFAIILSSLSNTSTYANFSTSAKNPGKTYHVVGKLNKDRDMIYAPEVNANLFTFFMIDNEGKESKVVYNNSKPQDFERAEQIVIVGKMVEDEFIASEILMKCPSKYNGNEQDQNNLSYSNESQ
ncbi:MAG TPA: cytochrome c maturation protein CcmE [Bacteroidia bacterium]|nr:cytochrome c maturation protein CcmE [Bacteroidia bacterium]HNT81052.1 cytochrome c maturation protein CcmE [Bacteroidia bacterium]